MDIDTVRSLAHGTRPAQVTLAMLDPEKGWGPPLPSPSSAFTHMVLLSGRLCPHGPKNPLPSPQFRCTFPDHFPPGEGRTFSYDDGSQAHPSQPPLPCQDLAQTLGLSQGCSALPRGAPIRYLPVPEPYQAVRVFAVQTMPLVPVDSVLLGPFTEH